MATTPDPCFPRMLQNAGGATMLPRWDTESQVGRSCQARSGRKNPAKSSDASSGRTRDRPRRRSNEARDSGPHSCRRGGTPSRRHGGTTGDLRRSPREIPRSTRDSDASLHPRRLRSRRGLPLARGPADPRGPKKLAALPLLLGGVIDRLRRHADGLATARTGFRRGRGAGIFLPSFRPNVPPPVSTDARQRAARHAR